MNLTFDVWIKYGDEAKHSPEQKLLLRTIWDYAYNRISLLVDEIEEEERKDNKPKAIVIYLMRRPHVIRPRGYSDELTQRIIECFNDKDAELMWNSVGEKLLSLMN